MRVVMILFVGEVRAFGHHVAHRAGLQSGYLATAQRYSDSTHDFLSTPLKGHFCSNLR
jgi:hypothetical protein